MIALGITGRSGCGKSTVTAVFSAHGVPLADADQISREILLPGSPLLPRLAQRFGADILKADGVCSFQSAGPCPFHPVFGSDVQGGKNSR